LEEKKESRTRRRSRSVSTNLSARNDSCESAEDDSQMPESDRQKGLF
jgi:hypothetical protein